jgi:hypothetical protein
MHRERLQQMVTMLRGLPEEPPVSFQILSWHCGTSACAVGHACLDPAFQEQGLELDRLNSAPVFDGKEGWEAVERFFGLTHTQATYLFYFEAYDSGSAATADEVADRIESFLAEQTETQ